ncbi:hypothetical protein EAE99_007759 [Botrytis elliptica]|nr:hypothetical protein EAE99_007759 [Botrytis elliptica]
MSSGYTEDDIAMALSTIAKGITIRKAGLNYRIPRTTLQYCIKGYLSHQKVQKALSTSPTHRQIREIGETLLKVKGNEPTLGKRWIHNFLLRNPEIRTKRQIRIDNQCISNAITEIISKFFKKLNLPAIIYIKPENRWNMNEAGIMKGQDLNNMILERKGLLLLIIYKIKSIQQQWFSIELDIYKDWKFHTTENEWTINEIGLAWLKEVFIPQTAPSDPKEARLLVLDGHGSHETIQFMFECFKNNIHLLFLPPHTSHVLQPLDLSIFSSLKREYRYELNKLGSLSDSTTIGKRNFLTCYQKARLKSLTLNNITSGWRASGLWPQNRAKPLLSRLLFENSNKEVQILNSISDDDFMLQWNIDSSLIRWETPQKANDLRKYILILESEKEIDLYTRRLLFRKIQKAFDTKDHEIMKSKRRIKELEHKLECRKVNTSPNSKFSGIKAIYQAQIEAGDREIDRVDSDSIYETDATEDYIVVG